MPKPEVGEDGLTRRQSIWIMLLEDTASGIQPSRIPDIAIAMAIDGNFAATVMRRMLKHQEVKRKAGANRQGAVFYVDYSCKVPEGISIAQVFEALGKGTP